MVLKTAHPSDEMTERRQGDPTVSKDRQYSSIAPINAGKNSETWPSILDTGFRQSPMANAFVLVRYLWLRHMEHQPLLHILEIDQHDRIGLPPFVRG
jgi:hypothetical protein